MRRLALPGMAPVSLRPTKTAEIKNPTRNHDVWGTPPPKLFFCEAELDHHALLAFVIHRKMAMNENFPVFFEVRTGDGFAARAIGIEGSGVENDVLAVKRAVALANRHGGLLRIEPHGGEAIRFGIEAGNSGASGFRSVGIVEREIGLQKLAALNHALRASAFRHDRLAVRGEETLHYIPLAHELREEFLTGAGCVRRFVFFMGLLRE
jgi:hypothetical protein